MIFSMPNLLSGPQVKELLTLAPTAFVDGMQTGGDHVRNIKNNREAELSAESVKRFDAIVQQALAANGDFQAIAGPQTIAQFIFSSYTPGHFYGDHADNAIMGIGAGKMRADLSMTIFLSDPADYDGGELVIDTDLATQSVWKLPAGHAVIYPSYSLHRVEPVTRGERRAAVSWIQCYVREADRRQTLIDITRVLAWMLKSLPAGQGHEHPEFRRLQKVRTNLIRMWSDV